MSEFNPSNSSARRPVLKLKIAPRKSPHEIKTAALPPPQSKLSQKPRAAWVSSSPANDTTSASNTVASADTPMYPLARERSRIGQRSAAATTARGAGKRSEADELKQRMQDDMDALLTR
jgi:hypothetical protein